MNYQRLAALSATQLRKFGRTVTLRRKSSGTYDPNDSSVEDAPADQDVTRYGAIFDFERGQTTERGTLISAGDKRLLLEPGVVPDPSDQVVVGGVVYNIVSVGEVNPAGTPVLYTLHLRR